MTRFLGNWRRLVKRLESLEGQYGTGGSLPQAMRTFAATGALPEHPGLRSLLLKHQAAAEDMRSTLPGMPVEEPGIEA
jgi:hypothetical protein